MLRSLDVLDNALPQENDTQAEAFHVGTFSDRLVSFHNVMTNPAFHTLFGNRDALQLELDSRENTAHDQIGQILISYGFAGLVLFGAVFVLGLWFAHRAIFRQRDKAKRELLIGILSIELATILSGMLVGSHLGVFPINVLFYLFASTVFTLGRKTESLQAVSVSSSPEAVATRTAAA
jgi:hypothetical protein